MANFIELSSHLTGYHVYQAVWVPTVGEILLGEREPDNFEDHIMQYASERTGV